MKSLSKTEKKCCLCGNTKGRSAIPHSARMQAWGSKRLRIPKNNRCCSLHLKNGQLTNEALELLQPSHDCAVMDEKEARTWTHILTGLAYKNAPLVDFRADSELTDDDYLTLTGFLRENFDTIMSYCGSLNNSSARSKRNAVAMLLLQLRLNLSQKTLCFLFVVKTIILLAKPWIPCWYH